METTVDAPGLPFLNNDTLRLAEPHIQNMLNTRLRFLVKVAAQVQLAETVVDPVTEEASELDSDVWIPLGPWAPGLFLLERMLQKISQLRFPRGWQQAAVCLRNLQESNYAEETGKARVVSDRAAHLYVASGEFLFPRVGRSSSALARPM